MCVITRELIGRGAALHFSFITSYLHPARFHPSMVYLASIGYLFLLNVGLGSAGRRLQQTACTTPEECRRQSHVLSIIGITNFTVGQYADYGCFYEGDTAFFGLGGTIEEMSESTHHRGRSRIWCSARSDRSRSATDTPTSGWPTMSPSWAPLPSPSSWQTDIPTMEPSDAPSSSPTSSFTAWSTRGPSDEPSSSPSSRPTARPTKMHTSQPTREPSPKPTAMPTQVPTSEPTREPSPKPTAMPSKIPTSQPTREPTLKPTVMPTNRLTAQPIILSELALAETQRVCRNEKSCNRRRQELGFDKYYVGSYYTKGCFSKGNVAYFGTGGTQQQKTEQNISRQKERIWGDFGASSNQIPSKNPTKMPRKRSIKEPLRAPSKTSVSSSISSDTVEDYCIDVEVVTDKYGSESGFNLSTNPKDGSDPTELFGFEVGSLESETAYSRKVCVRRGSYMFTMKDTFSGICCAFGKGRYTIKLDGKELITGGSFSAKIISHEILAGYDPVMSDRDKEWLSAHNTRRKLYHEGHSKEFIPLKWSPQLANDASNWVDKILPKCKIIRESHNDGENMSLKKYTSRSGNESPEDILIRWSDKLLELSKGYPENQTMTQVMWRASHYVGCSDKAAKMDDGAYCYVSICRYRRPGNCSVQSLGGWQIATLRDRTPCGKVCPEEGCH